MSAWRGGHGSNPTGALVRHFREGHLSERVAREAMQTWETMLQQRIVRLTPVDDLFDEAVEVSFRIRHALSDCLYLVLAKTLDARVITADEPMHDRGLKAYKKVGFLGSVKKH